MGVILWHRVELGLPGAATSISNDPLRGAFILDVDVHVTYGMGRPGTVKAELHDLPIEVTRTLAGTLEQAPEGAGGGVPITVELGYLDGGPQAQVVRGRIDQLTAEVRRRPLVTTVEGAEEAAFKLVNTRRISSGDPPARLTMAGPVTPQQVVAAIIRDTGVAPPASVTPATLSLASVELVGEHAFSLLDQLAERVGAEVLVQDDKALFGTAVAEGSAGPVPAPPDPGTLGALADLATAEDSLVVLAPFIATRLADFRPIALGRRTRGRVVLDPPPQGSVAAFDFTVLGHPGLRAGQVVVTTVREYDMPLSAFRIVEVTHAYSSRTGYVCTGRAARFHPDAPAGVNRWVSEQARGAGPETVVAGMANRVARSRDERPSIDVGRVKSSKPDQRATTLYYGQRPTAAKPSASIDADVPEDNPLLFDKPIAAAFAWHKVGLCVPVYPGMRALLAQNHNVREDAVVAGFLWANTPSMQRPMAKAGDWWLCLPTGLGSDNLPKGGGANDLIAADGRRVVEVAGLLLRVGKLTAVGTRPNEGAADELLIEHTSGTTVKVAKDGAVQVTAASGKSIVLTAGNVSLTVGGGKVQIGSA